MTTSTFDREIDTLHWIYGVPNIDQDVVWALEIPEITDYLLPAEVS